MRAHTTAALALLLAIPSEPASAAEHLTAPPSLVPNPVAQAWAAFEPGAWVRRRELRPTPDGGLAPVGEQIAVLAEKTAHDVVLRRGDVPAEAGAAIAWRMDQSDRIDLQGETHIAFGPAFDPWEVVSVTRGTDRREIAGKPTDLTTLEAVEKGGLERGFKLWLAPGIPGGVVGEEWSIGTPQGRRVTRGYLYVASGAKPGGAVPWPLPPEPNDTWKEDDAYAYWAKTPVGSWIRQTETLLQPGKDPYVQTKTWRLREVRPTRVVLQLDEPEQETTFLSRQRLLRPTPMTPEPRATARRKETLTVAGKRVECAVIERTYPSATGGESSTVTQWLAAEIPGLIVKQVMVEKGGVFAGEVTVLTEAWGKE